MLKLTARSSAQPQGGDETKSKENLRESLETLLKSSRKSRDKGANIGEGLL